MTGTNVELVARRDVAEVHAAGEFDMVSVGTLGAALREAISLDIDVVIDLTEATFVDIASARLIVDVRDRLQRSGRSLVVTNAPASVEALASSGRVRRLTGPEGPPDR
jgi:anti-anti-sigma factor